MNNWDAGWYRSIARFGYSPLPQFRKQVNDGFFPLVPLLETGPIHLGLPLFWVPTIEMHAASLGAAVALWYLVRERYGDVGATRATWLVYFSPAGYVLSMSYSEPLIILFGSLSLLALQRRQWARGGLFAALVTACDPVGIVAAAACAWAAFEAIRTRREWRALLAPLLAPLGALAFFTYLYVTVGSFLAYYHAQRLAFQNAAYFSGIPHVIEIVARLGVTNLVALTKVAGMVVTAVMLVFLVRRRLGAPGAWWTWSLMALFLGLLSPTVVITPRLLLRAFPLLALTGVALKGRPFTAVLVASGTCMVFLAYATSWRHYFP
jgi:Gpi18-like mannosyltransferase